MALAFGIVSTASGMSDMMAQKKVAAKTKKTASTANADSVAVRKLIDAAKKGDAEAQNTLGTYYYSGKKVPQNYNVALRWFSMAAKQKHVKAIANMGLCYQFGRGIEKDSVMAVKLYKESVKAGNAELVKLREENVAKKPSAFDVALLADLYYNGCGATVRKDTGKALKYYRVAAAQGSVAAMVKSATICGDAKMYAEALPYFKAAADKGDAYAEYKYGEYLCQGKGTTVDKATAAAYLDRAAKKNIPNAIMMLGDLLYKGDGVQQDYAKAMSLYKLAAAKKHVAAAWNVGIMYKKGFGVKSNFLMAMQWLAHAASNGMKKNFQKQLNDANVEINNGWKNTNFYTFVRAIAYMEAAEPDYANAVKQLSVLEKKGKTEASALIGKCYADKQWKKADAKKMVAYYEKGAKAGDPYACYLLAGLHYTGDPTVKVSKEKVVELYEKAAEANFAPAQCELGNLYFTGKIVSKDVSKAINYYNQALLNGYLSKEAAANLASCYRQGLGGVKKNAALAGEIEKRGEESFGWTTLLRSVTFE